MPEGSISVWPGATYGILVQSYQKSQLGDKFRVILSAQVCPNMQSQCGELMPSGRSCDGQGKSACHEEEE